MNILKELGIKAVNYGACSGTGKWSDTTQAGEIVSINPANGKKIASVQNQIMIESLAILQRYLKNGGKYLLQFVGNWFARWEKHCGRKRML